MKKILLLVIIPIIFITNFYSQDYDGNLFNINSVLPKTPEANGVVKFVNSQEDYFTGSSSIDIPLGSITCGSLSTSVSISYNTSGNKVAQDASWVGLGWNLNAGGMITRTVYGMPDDDTNGNENFLEFRQNNSIQDITDAIDYNEGKVIANGDDVNYYPTEFTILPLIANGCSDSQPDEFFFNVNGMSGSFFYDWDNDKPIIVSKYDIKIDSIYFEIGEIVGWKLLGPDGTKYFFEEYEITESDFNTSIFSEPYCSNDEEPFLWSDYKSSWYLTKISDINDIYSIDFTYINQDLYRENFPAEKKNYSSSNSSGCVGGSSSPTTDVKLHSKLISEITVSTDNRKIQFSSNNTRSDVVDFNGSNTLPQLDNVHFYDSNSNELFHWNLNHFYQNRLMLSSIQKFGNNNEAIPPYDFQYDNVNLPDVNSKQVDHWGYYNFNSTGNFIPNYDVTTGHIDDSNKIPDFNRCKASILKKIIEPTGGEIEFFYELNDIYEVVQKGYDSDMFHESTEYSIDAYSTNNENDSNFNDDCNDPSNDDICDYLEVAFGIEPWETYIDIESFNITNHAIVDVNFHGITFHNQQENTPEYFIYKDGEPTKYSSYKLLPCNDGDIICDDDGTLQSGTDHIPNLDAGLYHLVCVTKRDLGSPGKYDYISSTLTIKEISTETKDFIESAGLRIHKKIIRDGTYEKILRFEYEDNGKSSGVLPAWPRYKSTSKRAWYIESCNVEECFVTTMSSSALGYYPSGKGGEVGYEKVTVYYGEFGEFGKKVYTYTTAKSPGVNVGVNYNKPYGRVVYNNYKVGLLLDSKTYDSNTNLIESTTFDYSIFERSDEYYKLTNGDIYFNWGDHEECSEDSGGSTTGNNQPIEFYYPFEDHFAIHHAFIPHGYSKMINSTTIKDGVTTTIDYTYDSKLQNLLSSTISDGSHSKTTSYQYAEQLNETNLLNKHMVSVPLEISVNGGAGGGTKTDYEYFGANLLPSDYYSALENGSWKTMVEINSYDSNGNPELIKFRENELEDKFIWQNDLVISHKYPSSGGREWTYNYYDSRLLMNTTDHIGNLSEFQYDGLQRLTNSLINNGRINNSYSYQYQAAGYSQNKVTNILSYPNDASISSLTSESVFDGLGRNTTNTKISYTQSGSNFTTGQDFDIMGRVHFKIDPSSGGSTEYLYEASPIERVVEIIPAGSSHSIYKSYGTNAITISGYSPGTLFKTQTTDENGIISEEYTDIFGRKIQDIKDVGGLNLTTTYEYNDRDQITQIITPNPNITYDYSYYSDGLLQTKTIPDEGTYTYTYTAQDQIQNTTLPSGDVLVNTYDATYNDFITGVSLNGTNIISNSGNKIKGQIEDQTLTILQDAGGSSTIHKTFSYDDIGQVISDETQYPNANLIHNFSYNDAGSLKQTISDVTGTDNILRTFTTNESYDFGTRHTGQSFNFNSVTTQLSDKSYNNNEWLTQNKIGNHLFEMNFGYNSRGWLTSINNPNSIINVQSPHNVAKSEVFGMNLYYDTGNSDVQASPYYNGNISWIDWCSTGEQKQQYGFTYDNVNRITQAKYGQEQEDCEEGLINDAYTMTVTEYDELGNIKGLTRNGIKKVADCYEPTYIDSLGYSYYPNSSILKQVTENYPCDNDILTLPASIDQDADYYARKIIANNTTIDCDINVTINVKDGFEIQNSFEFQDNCATPPVVTVNQGICSNDSLRHKGFNANDENGDYQYSSGNMIYDPNKDLHISYNYLNLPQKIWRGDDPNSDYLLFFYDAEGTKIKKELYISGIKTYSKDYIGNVEYRNNALEAIYHSEGRITPKEGGGFQYEYYAKDQLGNIRVRLADKNGDGIIRYDTTGTNNEILENIDYYPFGMQINQFWKINSQSSNSYNYNNKELNTELGYNLHSYGKREYDAVLGRFVSVDPISEKYPFVSVFNYAEDEPIANLDLWGLQAFTIHGTNSKPSTFDNLSDQDIKKLSNNKTVNRLFSWPKGTNGFTNNQADRLKAAKSLSKFVLKNLAHDEDITLIGHSHGGNVAIQAINLIREKLPKDDNRSINLITISTPAYNGEDDPENPKNTSMNSHIHFYSEHDAVQTTLSDLMGVKKAERTYSNSETKNIKVNDERRVKFPEINNPGMNRNLNLPLYDPINSHFIQTKPELLKK